MKTLVTGGAGFIGSHLVESLLNADHCVVVLDNFSTGRKENLNLQHEKLRLVECDISKSGIWVEEFKGVDWVFHLAALADIVPSIQMPRSYFKSNVDGTFNVLQAAREANISRFIYAASSSCYGIPIEYPTSEDAEIRPQYPYALTKKMGEDLVMHWAQVYKLPSLSFRFFNVYGTRSRTSGTYGAVFGVFLAQKIAGVPLTVVGDGMQSRDFTYVTDVVSAMVAGAESAMTNKIYNVGSGKTVTVNQLTQLIGGDVINIPKRPGEPEITFANIKKISTELGWMPKVSIQEGVTKILESIEYWNSAPVWTPSKIEAETADWFKYLG